VTGSPQHNFLRSTTTRRRRVSLCRIKEKAIRQAAKKYLEKEEKVSLLLQ
jgi:hypothetical protein